MVIKVVRAACFSLILSAVTLFTLGAQAGEKVVLQLRWDHQFQFAGYYAAKWQGYYAAAGLDVDVKSSVTPERKFLSVIKEVSEGRADFGIGAADVLVARDKGHPLVLLASIFQQSAMGIIARKETALSSPADLTQLRVQRYIGDLVDAEFQAILKAEGIDPASIITPTGLPQGKRPMDLLAEGKIDAFPGYTLGVVWVAKERNIPLTILRPATYGVDFYGDSLFASERLTKENPELVSRFVEASLKGWQYALENPEEIAVKIANELPRVRPIQDRKAFNLFQTKEVAKLTHFPIVKIGNINPDRWKKMHQALREAGAIAGTFEPDKLIFDLERDARSRAEFQQNILIITLIVVLAAAVGFFIWSTMLKRAVQRRTLDLSESENRLHRIVEYTPISMAIVDQDGNIEHFNAKFIELFGWTTDDVRTPDEWWEAAYPDPLYRKEIKDEWEAALVEASESDTEIKPQQWRLTCKNGEVRNVEFRMVSTGSGLNIIVMDDITERLAAQIHLIQVSKLASLGEMATGVAHELSQPLNIIRMSSDSLNEIIHEGQIPDIDTLKAKLERISSQTERAAAIINHMKSFGRKASENAVPVSPCEAVTDAIGLLREQLRLNGIELDVHLPETCRMVKGDAIQLEQVILNLITNAHDAIRENVKGGSSGTKSNCITVQIDDDPSLKYMKLSVRDTGGGISEDHLDRIFEPFFTTKDIGKGTGVGLSICYSIIVGMGGTITAGNVDGGAEFNITLPAFN